MIDELGENAMIELSTKPFDPRAWNLFTGLALIAGCSSRPSSDGAEETSGTSTRDTEESTTEAGDGDCRSDVDCYEQNPLYPHCFDGVCVECWYDYQCGFYGGDCIDNMCTQDPSECWSESYYDGDCPQYQLCDNEPYGSPECLFTGTPAPECDLSLAGIPTAIDPGAPPLALSFVDVDDDGLDELAVATETQLLVYDLGVADPELTERAMPSNSIKTMVAAQFDDQAGDDLMLLVDDDIHGYFSDGISAFVNPSVLPSEIQAPVGLLAGDFDGQPPEDLWVWAVAGARLYLGGTSFTIEVEGPEADWPSVAAFEYTSPHASIMLGGAHEEPCCVHVANLEGAVFAADMETGSNTAVAVEFPGAGRFVTATYHSQNWSHIRFRDPATLDEIQDFVRVGRPSFHAGDFDGDQRQEVLAAGSAIELILGIFAEPCILPLELGIEPAPIPPAVGDHDGDGDDEFAVITAAGEVIVVDVE